MPLNIMQNGKPLLKLLMLELFTNIIKSIIANP